MKCLFYLPVRAGRGNNILTRLQFNNAEQAQETYDNFANKHTRDIHENQALIEDIITGKVKDWTTIERVLKQASDNQRELLKSAIGYISQAKKAECNYQYEKEDRKIIEKGLLPYNKTYCCVMKEPTLSRKEDIEQAGLKEGDLSILFRLIPCVGYNNGTLLNPDNGIPFISIADVAGYLGEKPSSDGKVAKAIQRLIKAGIIWRYGSSFIMNDFYIRCGQMTIGVLQKRKEKREKYQSGQGKKQTHRQGKKQKQKTTKNDVAEAPQTQATSGLEGDEKIPF